MIITPSHQLLFHTHAAVPCLLDADQFRDDLLTRDRKGGMQRAQRGQEQLPVGSVLLEASRQRGRKLQCCLGLGLGLGLGLEPQG